MGNVVRLERPRTPSKHEPSELEMHRRLGHDLIPLHGWNYVDKDGRERGKSPRDTAWRGISYRDWDAETHMAGGGNVGVRLRATDLVIDVDPRNFDDGDDPVARLCADFGIDIAEWPTVVTGGGGRHLYATKPADADLIGSLEKYPGIEFKTLGTQVVAAGSVHPNGARYEWQFGTAESPPAAPKTLLEALHRPPRAPGAAAGAHTPEEIAGMLAVLDPRNFASNERWLQIMFACHHGSGGGARQEFLEWCDGDPAYATRAHSANNAKRWDSADAGHGAGRVTVATLYRFLDDAGRSDVIPQRKVAADEFGTAPELPRTADEHSVGSQGNGSGSAAAVQRMGPCFTTQNGRVLNTLKNTMVALRAGRLGLAHDALSQRPVLTGERLPWRTDAGRELNDDVMRVLRHWIIDAFGWEPSKENVTEAALTLAFERQFNPVCDYLANLEWDGVERIDMLLPGYFGSRDTEYERAVGRKLLVAAVRRARDPGAKFDTMPILEGKQGTGKTSALRVLGGPWHSDAELGSVNGKDAPITLQGAWIMELGELTAMSKADVDNLKAFVSRTEDRFRPPYERTAKSYPRRCVFVGTTNATAYLRDLTGNRRFLPVETGKIDLEALSRHRDQLWAEAAVAEGAGETLELPRSLWPVAAERQADRTLDDPWETKVREYLSGPNAPTRISSTELLDEVLQVPSGRQNQLETKRLRQVMECLGWQYRRSVRIRGKTVVGYVSPADNAPDT